MAIDQVATTTQPLGAPRRRTPMPKWLGLGRHPACPPSVGAVRESSPAAVALETLWKQPADNVHALGALGADGGGANLEFGPGDVAWVLVSAALVLFMTPGLAFFYGGMDRSRNVLNMLMMNF